MSNIDNRIKDLGFELLKNQYIINIIEYINDEDNRIVTLQWDNTPENCIIFCRSSNSAYDDFGHEIDVSNGLDIIEAQVFIDKLIEMKNNTNHISVGVYSNGKYVVNVVRDEDLSEHIEYNKTMRFGRGLFVDGVCINQGYLSGEQVKNWTERISTMDIDITTPTIPYQ